MSPPLAGWIIILLGKSYTCTHCVDVSTPHLVHITHISLDDCGSSNIVHRFVILHTAVPGDLVFISVVLLCDYVIATPTTLGGGSAGGGGWGGGCGAWNGAMDGK